MAPKNPKAFSKFRPADVHKSLNEAYKQQRDISRNYWDTTRDIGADIKPPNVDELKSALPEIIKRIENDPTHTKAGLLPELKRWNDKLQGGTRPIEGSAELLGKPYLNAKGKPVQVPDPSQDFTAADAVNMRTSWNQHFSNNKFAQDPAYSAVSSAIDKTLESAASTNELFGKAHNLAKKQWLNNVNNAFSGNKVLKKFFSPEDFNAYKSLDKGVATQLPDATMKRIETMIPNIKTVAELNAVRRVLPKEASDYVASEVIKRAQSGDLERTMSGFASISPTPTGTLSALKNIYGAMTGSGKSDEIKAIIEAAKRQPERLTSYDSEYQKILEELAKQAPKEK